MAAHGGTIPGHGGSMPGHGGSIPGHGGGLAGHGGSIPGHGGGLAGHGGSMPGHGGGLAARGGGLPGYGAMTVEGPSCLHPHEVLLEDDLMVVVGGSDATPFTVTLTPQQLVLSASETGCCGGTRKKAVVLTRDVVSVRPAHMDRSKKKKKQKKNPVFMIVAYPATKARGKARERLALYFLFDQSRRRQELEQVIGVWVETLTEVCLGTDTPSAQAMVWGVGPVGHVGLAHRPLLVLLNPKSGQGKGEDMWEQAAGVLEEAGVAWEMVVTRRKGHAKDLIAHADLNQWRGVVIVSGDGLVHEVYNGLLAREDWRESLGLPVGVVPAGSGNALSRSLIHWQGEAMETDKGLMSSVVSVARSNLAFMDLMIVRGPKNEDVRLGFLSIGWGLISDVDIDSEPIRCLGSIRFTIYGLLRVARKRVYRATLSYIPADWPDSHPGAHPSESSWSASDPPPTKLSMLCSPSYHSRPQEILPSRYVQSWQDLDQRLSTLSITKDIHPAQDIHPSGRVQDIHASNRIHPANHPIYPHKHKSKRELAKKCPPTPTSPSPPHPVAPPPVYPPGKEPSPPCLATPESHPLTATPLHKDWVTETSDYLCVYIMNLPYLDRLAKFAPDASINDGVMWLVIIRPTCSRTDMINFMANMENGTHVNLPGVDYFPVTACRIQPDSSGPEASMTIDGEVIPAGPIQAHILPGAGRVMVK